MNIYFSFDQKSTIHLVLFTGQKYDKLGRDWGWLDKLALYRLYRLMWWIACTLCIQWKRISHDNLHVTLRHLSYCRVWIATIVSRCCICQCTNTIFLHLILLYSWYFKKSDEHLSCGALAVPSWHLSYLDSSFFHVSFHKTLSSTNELLWCTVLSWNVLPKFEYCQHRIFVSWEGKAFSGLISPGQTCWYRGSCYTNLMTF